MNDHSIRRRATDPITEELRAMADELRALVPRDSIDSVASDLDDALYRTAETERAHGYARALGRIEAAVELAVKRLRALAEPQAGGPSCPHCGHAHTGDICHAPGCETCKPPR